MPLTTRNFSLDNALGRIGNPSYGAMAGTLGPRNANMVHDVTDPEASATEPAQVEQPRRLWWTAAQMLGFGLLLALAILLAKGPPVDRGRRTRDLHGGGSGPCPRRVRAHLESTTVGRGVAQGLRQLCARRGPLSRGAARGLDRDDPLVKMSLVRKITMLGTVAAENREPTDAELKAYFDLRSERYRIPASFDLVQVSLSRDKHGEQIDAVAAERLAQLRETGPHQNSLPS